MSFFIKRFYLAFSFSLLTISIFSQSTSLGFEAFLNSHEPIFPNQSDIRKSNSIGLDFGGTIFFDINSKLQMLTGVQLSTKKIKIKDFSIVTIYDVDSTSFNDNNRNITYLELNQKQIFIKIPISLRVKLYGEENHIYYRGGFSVFWRTNKNTYLLLKSNNIENKIEIHYRPINLFILSSIGYEFVLYGRKKCFIEPLVELSLANNFLFGDFVSSFDSNKSEFISFGINFGIRF